MKYYIDFEASDEENIISIGCVSENDRRFYSLVHCDETLSADISELTLISQEDIDAAAEPDQVFADFFDWCQQDDEKKEFICYGDSDVDFVYNTYLNCENLKAAAMLSYIYLNMYDCSGELKDLFYVNKTISLQKLAVYFIDDQFEQNHNALDDALLLKRVYEAKENHKHTSGAFNEYLDPYKIPYKISKILRISNGEVVEEYESMAAVGVWIHAQSNDKNPSYLNNFEDKIRKAVKEGGKYFGYNWRIL